MKCFGVPLLSFLLGVMFSLCDGMQFRRKENSGKVASILSETHKVLDFI